jgi:hypothetical protein
MLARLEEVLGAVAAEQGTLTYAQLAKAMKFVPPNTIHQITELLAELMRKQATDGVPQLASLVISRARGGLPAPGFFMLLDELAIYRGSVDGDDAKAFHDAEKKRCYAVASVKNAADPELPLQ